MSDKRIKEITRELEKLTLTAQSVQGRFAAHMGLHSAAVLDGDDKEQLLEHRKAAHVLLDRLFDNGERMQRLSEELSDLVRIR